MDTGQLTTLCGSTLTGVQDGSCSTTARMQQLTSVVLDHNGIGAGSHIFVSDTGNHAVRMLWRGSSGAGPWALVTVAGSLTGLSGNLDGLGASARLSSPSGLALTSNNQILYVADAGNQALRVLNLTAIYASGGTTTDAMVSTITVVPGLFPFSTSMASLVLSITQQQLYMSDRVMTALASPTSVPGTGVIHRVDLQTRIADVLLGVDGEGCTDGPLSSAQFAGAPSLSISSDGRTLLAADWSANSRVRVLPIDGDVASSVQTVMGGLPSATPIFPGSLSGTVDGSTGPRVQLLRPRGLAHSVDGSVLFVASQDSVRAVLLNTSATAYAAAAGFPAASGYATVTTLFPLVDAVGIAASPDGTRVVVSASGSHLLYEWLLATRALSPWAGVHAVPGACDNAVPLMAGFRTPTYLAYTATGAGLFIADTGNHKIRMMDQNSGVVTTVVGGGSTLCGSTAGNFLTSSSSAQNVSALMTSPRGLAVSSDGLTLFVATQTLILRVVIATATASLLAGSSSVGYTEGTASSAQFNGLTSLVLDPARLSFIRL